MKIRINILDEPEKIKKRRREERRKP